VHTSAATGHRAAGGGGDRLRRHPTTSTIDVYRSSGPCGQSVNTTDSEGPSPTTRPRARRHLPRREIPAHTSEHGPCASCAAVLLRDQRERQSRSPPPPPPPPAVRRAGSMLRAAGRTNKIRTYTKGEPGHRPSDRLDPHSLDQGLAGHPPAPPPPPPPTPPPPPPPPPPPAAPPAPPYPPPPPRLDELTDALASDRARAGCSDEYSYPPGPTCGERRLAPSCANTYRAGAGDRIFCLWWSASPPTDGVERVGRRTRVATAPAIQHLEDIWARRAACEPLPYCSRWDSSGSTSWV